MERKHTMNKTSSVLSLLLVSCTLFAQGVKNNQNEQDANDLLSKYIQSKGSDIICFDTSNIKQFWIDNSVASRKDAFEIALTPRANTNESVPLKIQLINVNESQDCKIEVITSTEDFNLSVLNSNNSVVPSSSSIDSFIDYIVFSSVFHLENTQNTSFKLVFSSKTEKTISIKSIILSFSKNLNGSFLASPGKLMLSEKSITSNSKFNGSDDSSFSITGKKTALFSSKKILVANNTLSTSVKIKNTGDNPTAIYLGYSLYSKDRLGLNGTNYPYSNQVLDIISAEKDSNRIIVDSYTDWAKQCCLALDAREDLSDIPNNTFIPGRRTSICLRYCRYD